MTSLPRVAGDDVMDELVRVLGETPARDLARHFGGTSIYVPRLVGVNHPIRAVIGAAADALAAWAGGSAVAIPKQAERRARVIAMAAQSVTYSRAQIARETGYSERHVYRLLREDDAARQPGLFDDL